MFMLDNNTWIQRELLGEVKNARGTKFRLTRTVGGLGALAFTIWIQRTEGGRKGWRYMSTSADETQQRRRLENLKASS